MWEGGDVVLLEFSSCTLVVRKLPDSSRIIFYFRSKMSPLIPYLQFVANLMVGLAMLMQLNHTEKLFLWSFMSFSIILSDRHF